jgi:GNAT superfamily N-acetyltransferase
MNSDKRIGDGGMAEVLIEQLTEATEAAVREINGLLPQLTTNVDDIDLARLEKILAMSGQVYVARADGVIVGMVQRVDVYQPRWVKSWIEDYVVDGNFRGQGIATRLLKAAIDSVPAEVETINLTSKKERTESHGLYAKLGFVQRDETTVWRLKLPEDRGK